jgi:molecular chaperone DnaK
MRRIVGIDLGTTFSAIAYVNDKGNVEAIPNADDKLLTPSAVLIEGDRIEVGDIALNQWMTNEEHVVRWIKRAMGNPEHHFQGLSPVEISAEILKSLKADAEAFLGVPLEEAVITCPAYFAAVEIENTKRAGELAGFQVREIVKEPTAAAVYYGIEKMEDGEAVMVCDLGGGTYDATILSFESGVFVPRASMGDRMLGGHDWTMELLELAAQRLREVFGEDPRNDLMTGQLLYEACEQAKRDFARTETVAIPCRFKDQIEQVTITRDEFETQTEYLIQSLVMWSEHALEKARMTWDDIDRILMVGGASRLRRMGLALEEVSGKKPILSPQPDLIVALGAAVLARGHMRVRGGLTEGVSGCLIDVDYKRVNTRSLGTRAIVFKGNKARITNALIIPHGTGTPVSRSRDDFELASTGQDIFEVPVVEFESDDDYDLVGNYQFTCLPDAKRGDRIEVTFNYDVSGIVDVEAVDVGSGQALACERLLTYEDPDVDEIKVGVRPSWAMIEMMAQEAEELLSRVIAKKPEAAQDGYDLLIKAMREEAEQAFANQNGAAWQDAFNKMVELCDRLGEMISSGWPQMQPESVERLLSLARQEAGLLYVEDVIGYLPTDSGEARSTGSPEVPGGTVDRVHFSVTAPPVVSPGFSFVLDIWAHLAQQREAVLLLARKAVGGEPISMHSKGPVQVARGVVLTVRLNLDDLLVEEPEDTILWEGEIGNATFAVQVPRDAKQGPRRGKATIYNGALQIARIDFIVRVGEAVEESKSLDAQITRHRQAFASYARADLAEVFSRIQGLQKADSGMKVFWEWEHRTPRSDQHWEQAVGSVIRTSDIFYLFWSANARQSRWVEREWRYALNRRGLDFIDPVPLVPPEQAPPPPELADIRFDDWTLAFSRKSRTDNDYAVSLPEGLVPLFQQLIGSFNEEGLRTLCFSIDVDYDSLPGRGKAAKARELVLYLHRTERIGDLLDRCRMLRPKTVWQDVVWT